MKRARDIREQLVGLMERVEITLESCGDDDVALRKALCAGFFYNVAQLSKPGEGGYKTVKHRRDVYIHPGSGARRPGLHCGSLLIACVAVSRAGCNTQRSRAMCASHVNFSRRGCEATRGGAARTPGVPTPGMWVQA